MEPQDAFDMVIKKNVPLWTQLLDLRVEGFYSSALLIKFPWSDILALQRLTLSTAAITAAADVAGQVAVACALDELGQTWESMRVSEYVMQSYRPISRTDGDSPEILIFARATGCTETAAHCEITIGPSNMDVDDFPVAATVTYALQP